MIGRVLLVGFSLAIGGGSSHLAAPGAVTRAARSDTSITVQACRIAATEQLRFVIAAGLARVAPATRATSVERLTISHPQLVHVSCTPLRIELAVTLHRALLGANLQRRDSTMLRFLLGGIARVSYRAVPDLRPTGPEYLSSASLCLRPDSSIKLDRGTSAINVDTIALHALLARMASDACFDITSLVYVFLQRGGTLAPAD